jgi:AcrR family transcriptional regulator
MPRTYTMRRRAEQQEETRQRIVDAALALFEDGSPSLTAIADVAGVGRVTLYRHFADEAALIAACLDHHFALRPIPTAAEPGTDADARLRATLGSLYGAYGDASGLFDAAWSAATTSPVVDRALRPLTQAADEAEVALAGDWPGAGPGSLVSGAIHHALSYGTWRSLHRTQGLTNAAAVELMAGLVRAASGSIAVGVADASAASRRG